jgi:hypothetical protein
MACARFRQRRRPALLKCSSLLVAMLLAASVCRAQTPAPAQAEASDPSWLQDLHKYPGLMAEFSQLILKLRGIQFPPARSESPIDKFLPETTMSYAAIPNYGDAAHQALNIFHKELQSSTPLRDWWQHGDIAKEGPKIEAFLEQFVQFSQYLGQEIVVSGALAGKDYRLLVVAEVHKPGFKAFLEQTSAELAGKSKPVMRIVEPKDLATARELSPPEEFLVLVRPDSVIVANDLASLRNFSARLDSHTVGFTSTPFGQKVASSYEGGVTMLGALDVKKLLSQIPPGASQDRMMLERTGLADMKYLVWEHQDVKGSTVSQAELSFTGPRRGIASWLAKPAPLGSLDFASARAVLLLAVRLSDPAQIFEDFKELETASNPNAFAALPAFERAFNLSLKDDILNQLTGETTAELLSVKPPKPEWRIVLGVKDQNHLQQTLATLVAAAHLPVEHFDDAGVAYSSIQIPSSPTQRFVYAFVEGYLIVASSHETLSAAIQMHRNGESLAKSKNFLASLPPGHDSGISALFYEDPLAMAALQAQRFAPEFAQYFSNADREIKPSVICAYGEEKAIREVNASGALDVPAVLVAAAIAIPNLLRARSAANDASAVGSIRTIVTAQVTYASMYPQKGFAPDLASLGPDPDDVAKSSPAHAGLLDESLGNPACTPGESCTKSGFRFKLVPLCKQSFCKEFVAFAVPVASDTGTRSFCATSDGVIRFKPDNNVLAPPSPAACQAWSPLQ